MDEATAQKSALRQDSCRSSRHVRWADEAEQKAPIRLADLIDVPCDVCPHVQGRVWELSQDSQGCREVQEALERASPSRACVLAAELRTHVRAAAQCPHANHVLRKVITTLPAQALNFILDELLSQGACGLAEVCKHRFGCRIVEVLLLHGIPAQIALISECLLSDAPALCNHMYANFVMQRLVEHSSRHHRHHLGQSLLANITSIGANFYGSAVLGTALQHGNESDILELARAVAAVPGLLSAIAKYKHGKGVLTSAIGALSGAEREAAERQLSAPALKVPKTKRN